MSSPHPRYAKTSLSLKPPVHQNEFSIEKAFKNIKSSLDLLDFNEFFKKFDLDSPVCQFMEAFSTAQLHALISRAFAEANGLTHNSSAVKGIRKAKKALDDELRSLDAMFKVIEAATLNVGTVRNSLHWLREVNRQSLERLDSVPEEDHAVVYENARTSKQSHYSSEIPSVPFPAISWQQQQQCYHDTCLPPFGNSRPQNFQRYGPPPQHISYHHISDSIPLRSPTLVPFPSQNFSVEQEELDVPFIPPPPSPLWSAPNVK